MGLGVRNSDLEWIARRVAQILAGRCTMAQINSDGEVQARGRDNEEVLQQAHTHHVQHFGFRSVPPADTEMIRVPVGDGDAILGERDAIPSSLSSQGSGTTAIYDSTGNLIHCNNDGGIDIKAVSGKTVEITAGGSAVETARKGDETIADTDAASWTAAVSAFINTVSSGLGQPAWPWADAGPSDWGVINDGSSKVKVE